MFKQNWSLLGKANVVVWSALALALLWACVRRDSSLEPHMVPYKSVVPTLTAASPTAGLSTEAPVHPRPVVHVPGAAYYAWDVTGYRCWLRGLRVQFFRDSQHELWNCGAGSV